MEIWQLLVLALCGVVAGFLNVMAGGGSLLSVPVLLFMGLPGPVANGTNRIAILAQNATAAITFIRQGHKDLRLSLTLGLASVPGAILGASLGVQLEGEWFERFVALVMIGVMVLTSTGGGSRTVATATEVSRKRLWLGHIAVMLAGVWGGLIQLGIGFILMPILQRILGLDLVRVNAHKVIIILTYTIAALLVFANNIELMWVTGLVLAVGMSIGGWLGARVTISKGEHMIKTVLNIVLAVFIVKLLLF
jgi:uncharacterized membrane protein YfcA